MRRSLGTVAVQGGGACVRAMGHGAPTPQPRTQRDVIYGAQRRAEGAEHQARGAERDVHPLLARQRQGHLHVERRCALLAERAGEGEAAAGTRGVAHTVRREERRESRLWRRTGESVWARLSEKESTAPAGTKTCITSTGCGSETGWRAAGEGPTGGGSRRDAPPKRTAQARPLRAAQSSWQLSDIRAQAPVKDAPQRLPVLPGSEGIGAGGVPDLYARSPAGRAPCHPELRRGRAISNKIKRASNRTLTQSAARRS